MVLVYMWYCVSDVHAVLQACGHCVVMVSSHAYSLCFTPSVGTCILWCCTLSIDGCIVLYIMCQSTYVLFCTSSIGLHIYCVLHQV